MASPRAFMRREPTSVRRKVPESAEPITPMVRGAEPTALALREPVGTRQIQEPTALAQRRAPVEVPNERQWNETTRLRMELARAKADLAESENQAHELREQSRQDLQDMLRQLKDSEQQLWNLHAKQASYREQQEERCDSEYSLALAAVEHLQHLLTFLHPERLQEDAMVFYRGEDPEALPPLPMKTIEISNVSRYVQKSLKWSSDVVAEARHLYFRWFSKLRNFACSTLLHRLARVSMTSQRRQCLEIFNLFKGGTKKVGSPERLSPGTLTTHPAMEDSWQSWRSWLRSSPNTSQKPPRPHRLFDRMFEKTADDTAGSLLTKALMHWRWHCCQRRFAVQSLVKSFQHCQEQRCRRALQIFRVTAGQRSREKRVEDMEVLQRRVTHCRRYWSAHLLMRVERGMMTRILKEWQKHCLEKPTKQETAERKDAMAAWQQRLRVEVMAKVEKLCSSEMPLAIRSRSIFLAWKLLMEKVKLHTFYQERWKDKQKQHSLQWTWAAWRNGVKDRTKITKHKRLVEKRHAKDGQRAKFLFSHWFAWTSFQRHTTRWHNTFVRMLHGARCNRAVILLQAALASWQQYTLRKRFDTKHSRVQSQLRSFVRVRHLQRCFQAWAVQSKCFWLQMQNRSDLARIRSMSSSFGVHLIERQVLQYLLCQWHHWVQARTYRRASVSQRHIQKERQMLQKVFLHLYHAIAKQQMRQTATAMLVHGIKKLQLMKCLEVLHLWTNQQRLQRHRLQVQKLVKFMEPKVQVRLYFQAWREAKASRRPVKHLAELKTSKFGVHLRQFGFHLRTAFISWRGRCRRCHPVVLPTCQRHHAERRLILWTWHKLVQSKRSARVRILQTGFKEWMREVERRHQLRHMHLLAVIASSRVRHVALLTVVLVHWSQLARDGRQAAVNVSLMASSRQWLVAAVTTGNRSSLAWAWHRWNERVSRGHQALHMKCAMANVWMRSHASLLRMVFHAFKLAVNGVKGVQKLPKRQMVGETFAVQHHWWLLSLTWHSLRWNAVTVKCQRSEGRNVQLSEQLQELDLRHRAMHQTLKHRFGVSLSVMQRKEEGFNQKSMDLAFHAWHQVAKRKILRLPQAMILRPVGHLIRLGVFLGWKAQVVQVQRRYAMAMCKWKEGGLLLVILFEWSRAVRRLRRKEERQHVWALFRQNPSQLLLQRMLYCWRSVVVEVKKNFAFLQRSVALRSHDPSDRRQVAVCWAFWRLYIKQIGQVTGVTVQQAPCGAVLQCWTAWALTTQQARHQRREMQHMERKRELWVAKSKHGALRLSFGRWHLHLETSKLLLKADLAVALKASIGLLIVLRFCWTSWALVSSHRCSLAEQGQMRKMQGIRHLVSTLRRSLALRLNHLFAKSIEPQRSDRRAVQAWRDFHGMWISKHLCKERLRAFCHAWHVVSFHATLRLHRWSGAAETLELGLVTRDRVWLSLVLKAWRSIKGRTRRLKRHSMVAFWRCGAMGIKSVLHLWRLQVQKLHQIHLAHQTCTEVRMRCVHWHCHQTIKAMMILCFFALRCDALTARARKTHARLTQVWTDQLHQERLAEETRRQRAARNFEKEIGQLKARSFSDGRLQAMKRLEPLAPVPEEPFVTPEPVVVEPVVAMEPVVSKRRNNSPPTKLAPKLCAARSVVVLDRGDQGLLELLQKRGAIEETLSLHTSRLLK